MNPTPHMPVAEHQRRLAISLFQIANGFGLVMRGVADAAEDVADPVFAEVMDPRWDTRPGADSILNPAFVAVPGPVKQSARDHRRTGFARLPRATGRPAT